MKLFRYLLIIFLSMVIAFSCQEHNTPEIGYAAPDFTVHNLEGQQIKLSDFKGKNVLLHFWSDYCTECRREFTSMKRSYEKVNDEDDFIFLWINSGQSKSHVQSINNEYDVKFLMMVDEYASAAKLYGVTGLPTTFFIAKDGKIIEIHHGWLTEDYIDQKIKSAKNL